MRIITLYSDESQRQRGRKKLALSFKDSCMNYQMMPEPEIVFHGARSRRLSLGLTLSLSKAVDKVVSELRSEQKK